MGFEGPDSHSLSMERKNKARQDKQEPQQAPWLWHMSVSHAQHALPRVQNTPFFLA